MKRILLTSIFLLLLTLPAAAVVELAREGKKPTLIEEVYIRDGAAFIAIDDVLEALEINGYWDSVQHVYFIRTPRGQARISPGSRFLRIGEQYVPLDKKPRFIDSRLRVTESFVTLQLPQLMNQRLFYRNLNPNVGTVAKDPSAIDRLFNFLLRKKKADDEPALRAIAIDPGHGGQDPGVIGISGLKEKEVTLAVARQLQKQLKMQLDIPIYLTRDDDYGLTAEQRLEPAARPDVDALLLLHAQSAGEYKPQGIYLYVRPEQTEIVNDEEVVVDDHGSRELAELLADALRNEGLHVHGVYRAPLLPLGRGDLPTVLVEMGYLTNPGDRVLLSGEEGQKQFATALYNGLREFGKVRTEETSDN